LCGKIDAKAQRGKGEKEKAKRNFAAFASLRALREKLLTALIIERERRIGNMNCGFGCLGKVEV